MKNLKKVLALALAIIMTLTLCSVAFADDPPTSTTYTISVSNTDTHSYDVYQIFTGDYDDATGILSDIKWGANGTGTPGDAVPQSVLEALEAVEGASTDSAKLAAILTYVNLTSTKVATVTAASSYTAAPGYYLIKDASDFDPEDGEEAYTKYIVKVVDNVAISRKADGVPTSDKVIVEGNNEVDVNEAGIGDTINYKITAHVPADATAYDYYYFIINDTMDAELTFVYDDDADVVVTVNNATLEEGEDYYLYTGTAAGDYTFRIALADAKTYADKDVIVSCKAILNDAAVVADPAQNKENVTYSNNPNFTYAGTNNPDQSGLPYPSSTSTIPTGETPVNTVETYTTKLTVFKVDEDGNALTGAEFTLTGDTNQIKVSTAVTYTEDTAGTYYKLNNGQYTTEAPITADRMEPAGEGATAGYVTDPSATGEDAITINGLVYRPYTEDDEGPIFILIEANEDLYESTATKYTKAVTTQTLQNAGGNVNIKGFVADDGTISFEGLGAGTYTLTESAHPDGYNTIAPITFTVSFDNGNKTFSTNNSKIVLNGAAGLETTIVNEKGSTLPETGGIGTTIFYVLGSILLAAAAVLLITKKRMSVKG